MRVLGIERISYTNKEGREVNGTKLHCCFESNKVEGVAVLEPIYCNNKVDCSGIAVGDEIEIYYNAWNKPVAVEVLQ